MRLRLNTNKMEYITFGSKAHLWKISTKLLTTGNDIIQMTPDVKYLRGTLDSKLNFNQDVTMKIWKAMSNISCIKAILKYLTKQACTTLVFCLCIPHLNYSNALLYGFPKIQYRLQTVQNLCAKLVLQCSNTPVQHKHSWTFPGSQLNNESTTRY